MRDILKGWEAEYDVVLVDIASVMEDASGRVLSRRMDGVVLVYDPGKVYRSLAGYTKDVLDRLSVPILGVVMVGRS